MTTPPTGRGHETWILDVECVDRQGLELDLKCKGTFPASMPATEIHDELLERFEALHKGKGLEITHSDAYCSDDDD